MKQFFISGCYRSGTTLVEKFVNNQEGAFSYFQPFISIFSEMKKRFYEQHSINNPKWLGYDYNETFSNTELNAFLDHYKVSEDFLKSVFHESSFALLQKFKEEKDLDELKNLNFASLYQKLLVFNKSASVNSLIGAKEILCHEFVAYFAKEGIKTVLVIRDPRRVIRSLNFGKEAFKYVGDIRPTLLNLHNWRESAEIAIQLQASENVHVIRFEDFIKSEEVRMTLCEFLGIKMSHKSLSNLLDENGEAWDGNSSFNKGEESSYALTDYIIEYIESVCFKEMEHFAYEPSVDKNQMSNIIRNFKEPFEVADRFYYDKKYSSSAVNINYELNRLASQE